MDVRADHPYERVMADNERHADRFHRAFLASGVTAVFDVGGYPWTRRLADATASSADAPHVRATGALLTTWEPQILGLPDQKQFVLMQDEATTRAAVRAHAAAGSAAIKVWYITTADLPAAKTAPLVHAAGDEAKRLGLPLVVHATSLETATIAVAAGAHLLVHSVEDKEVDDAFVAACVAAGTFYCPTLTVRRGYAQLYSRRPSAEVEEQLAFVHESVAARVRSTTALPEGRRTSAAAVEAMNRRLALQGEVMAKNLLRLHRAGVPVVLGTDAGNPLTLHGPSVFPEMEAMQSAGLSARAVITASTRDAARALPRGDGLGRIAAGCSADLLVLGEDPAVDVRAFRSIERVCRAGVVRTRQELVPR
jgi:imidazolonepropionase-like amidohydrolase